MQALFLISFGAIVSGGAIALGALFHRFSIKPASVGVGSNDARARSRRAVRESRVDELERRERSFSETCKRANDELDAKRRALEALTRRADEAAEALGRALDLTSLALGTRATALRTAAPFELNEFDLSSRSESTRRDDGSLRGRQAKVA